MRSSPLLRNLMAVASGTAAGQVVAVAFSPLITRIYSPEVFGLQGVFLSLVSILSPAIALRYPMAIVVAETGHEARQISFLSVVIAFCQSVLLGLLLLATKGSALNLLGAEKLGALIYLLPLALFSVALQDVADFSAARSASFRLVGLVTVIQAFLMNLARVLGGLVAPIAGVLIVVTTLAPAVQAAMLRLCGKKSNSSALKLTGNEAKQLLRKHLAFPLYRVSNDVINATSQAVPVILLAALYSPAAAGLYTLTRVVLNMPTNVIGTAVGNVLYTRFAELSRESKPLLPLYRRATLGLSALAPIIIGLAWFSPNVLSQLFGEEWREAGHYAQWMVLRITMIIINLPTERIAPIVGRQDFMLLFNIALLAIRVLSFVIAKKNL